MNVGLIIGIFFIVSIFATIVIGINQETTYNTSMNCDELKECILLDIGCLDRHVKNKLFIFEWEFDNKAYLFEQKEYYIKECIYKDRLE